MTTERFWERSTDGVEWQTIGPLEPATFEVGWWYRIRPAPAPAPLPCPFCGAAFQRRGESWATVHDSQCCGFGEGSSHTVLESGVWAWNRRAPCPECANECKREIRHQRDVWRRRAEQAEAKLAAPCPECESSLETGRRIAGEQLLNGVRLMDRAVAAEAEVKRLQCELRNANDHCAIEAANAETARKERDEARRQIDEWRNAATQAEARMKEEAMQRIIDATNAESARKDRDDAKAKIARAIAELCGHNRREMNEYVFESLQKAIAILKG